MQPANARTIHSWTQGEIIEVLIRLLPQVAPLKVTGPVFPETSLAQDLDFDSLDTIEMLIAVNEEFAVTLDFEAWLEAESRRKDTPFTIRSLSLCILETLGEGDIR